MFHIEPKASICSINELQTKYFPQKCKVEFVKKKRRNSNFFLIFFCENNFRIVSYRRRCERALWIWAAITVCLFGPEPVCVWWCGVWGSLCCYHNHTLEGKAWYFMILVTRFFKYNQIYQVYETKTRNIKICHDADSVSVHEKDKLRTQVMSRQPWTD